MVFVIFFGFHVHVHYVLLNLMKFGYQIVLHHSNQGMPVFKVVIVKNTWTSQQ